MSIAQPTEPGVTWSQELPVKLKCAIADCVTLYSKIESCIVEILWALEEATLERKQEIAKKWGKNNFRAIKTVLSALPGARTAEIWTALERIRNERNLIGHGVWMIASNGRPVVVWHSKFLESDDWVGGEYFDWGRFDLFLSAGEVLLKTFSDILLLLHDQK